MTEDPSIDRPWAEELRLGRFAELLEGLATLHDALPGEGPLQVESIEVTTPFDIDVGAAGGRVEIRAEPPRETTATSVRPVLHTLRVRIQRTEGRPEGANG